MRAYRERWQKIVKAQGEDDEDRSDWDDDEDADGSEGALILPARGRRTELTRCADEGVDLEAVLNAAPPPGVALTMNWSPQDDAQLIDGVSADPPLTWYQIGERMNPPRLGADCLKRWYHSGKALAPRAFPFLRCSTVEGVVNCSLQMSFALSRFLDNWPPVRLPSLAASALR